jgi:hypothetical protein
MKIMSRETSSADFVRKIRTICGRNDTVVQNPAVNPIRLAKAMDAPVVKSKIKIYDGLPACDVLRGKNVFRIPAMVYFF